MSFGIDVHTDLDGLDDADELVEVGLQLHVQVLGHVLRRLLYLKQTNINLPTRIIIRGVKVDSAKRGPGCKSPVFASLRPSGGLPRNVSLFLRAFKIYNLKGK